MNNKINYSLLSVYDKQGIIEFAKTLQKLDYKIISTGGTAKKLSDENISVVPISEITSEPESFDGRMKTISFQIESGILFDRKNLSHQKQANQLGIKPIDIVVCNLYPFEKESTIENIDVGGPTMIRAAAKNFKNVIVVIDPHDYAKVSEGLLNNSIPQDMRQELAAKAFAHLSLYDSLIARFLNKKLFPEELTLPLRKIQDLRYGENPHQKAAFYLEPKTNSPLKSLNKIAGRDLSLVNLTDINAGIESVRLFKEPCAVVIKHNSPCGIAIGNTISQALGRAIEADPESAFGGIIVVNKKVDEKTVKKVSDFKNERKSNIDIFAAPEFDQKAVDLLIKTRKSLGVYSFAKLLPVKKSEKNLKFVLGGAIIQTLDYINDQKEWKIVTKKKPSKQQLVQMKIAWKFISRIKSNTIIIMDKELPMTRGIGSGQTSRIKSTEIALLQARHYTQGAVLASDSFFPFSDSVNLAVKHGISAIVQQGGSIKDQAIIDAANSAGIAMVFTNRRAFWH